MLLGAGGAADDAAPRFAVGFEGVFQVGRWTPATVHPPTGSSPTTARVTSVDVDGRPVDFPLESQPDGSFRGLIQTGRLDAPLTATLATPEGDVQRTLRVGGDGGLTALRQETHLWILVGEHTGFQFGAQLLNASSEGTGIPRVQPVSMPAASLPQHSEALRSVHALVLGPQVVTEAQSFAMRDWVQRGGRLVLIAGGDAAAFSSGPLASWLPVEIGPTYEERQTAALTGLITAYVPNKGILRSLDPLRLARLELKSGQVLINGPTAPAAVRCAYGLGTITVVALDLESPPFITRAADGDEVHWGGLALMCVQLAGETLPTPGAVAAERQLQLAPTGVSDIYSQLAGILDHFPTVQRASNWNVIGLLAVYLLLIGPVDYLLVHRLLKRPQWTWATLPAWVLLASWWATATAARDNGDAVLTRQFELLDVAADTGIQRTHAWFSLYSPQTQRCDVAWRPQHVEGEAAGALLAGVGRPEPGFRGLYRRGGIQVAGAGYELDPGIDAASANNAPVDQWSSISFDGTGFARQSESQRPLAECRQIVSADGSLVKFELTHDLPGPIEDWFVVQRMEATFPMPSENAPRQLPPGVPCDLLRGCGQKLLPAYVRGELTTTVQRKTGSETYIRSGEYDPLGLDPHLLFRALSFHEAVGGSDYTHLTNHTLQRLDLSPLIHLDRVIVFGRLAQGVSEFQVNGAPARPHTESTFVRLVVPIQRELRGSAIENPQPSLPEGPRRD
jgi:hypothetical protein